MNEAERKKIEEKYSIGTPVVEDTPIDRAAVESKYGITTADPAIAAAEKARQEELRAGVTGGRVAKHVLTGIPTGVGETLDAPHTISNLARGGTEWAANKILGVEDFKLPGVVSPFPFLNEAPAITDFLKKLPFGEDIAEYTRPELTEEEIEASPLAEGADLGRTAAEWFQPLNKTQVVSEAIMATLAAAGDWAGDEIGETVGGISGALLSLLKGKTAKLSKADTAALKMLTENLTEGQTIDDVLVAANKAIEAGEVGTLGDYARNRGIMKVEEYLKPTDQDYANELIEIGLNRDTKVADEVTIPFRRTQEAGQDVVAPMRPIQDTAGVPTPDPSLDAARRDVESRLQQVTDAMDEDIKLSQESSGAREADLGAQIEEVAARDIPSSEPALLEAEQRAKAAALRGSDKEAAAAARIEADAALVPLRYEQIVEQVPVADKARVFEGTEAAFPKVAQQKADDYWAVDAFQEVKGSKEKFTIGEDVTKRIGEILNMDGIRLEFEDYMSKVVDATRRVKGISKAKKQEFISEEGVFDSDGYINAVMNGEITGNQIMALRNYFAGSDVGNLVKRQLDEVIISQLSPTDAAKYKEQMAIYPQHLTQKSVADQNAVFLEEGRYTPEQRVGAGKQFDRPGGEADIEAYQNIKQTEAGLQKATAAEKTATAEGKAADAAAARAQRLENTASSKKASEQARLERQLAAEKASQARLEKATEAQAGKDVKVINEDIRGQYAQKPAATLKKVISAEDGAPKLKALYESLTDLGEKESFRMEVGRAVLDTITDASGRVLPKSNSGAHAMNNLRNTLHDSGVLSGSELEEISKSIDQLAVEMLRKNVTGRPKSPTDADINEFGSAAVAALAVNLAPGASTSLIMGGTIRKIINRHLKQMAEPEKILESIREITKDPKKFVEAMEKAKTEKEAIEIFKRLWFSGVVAGQILPEGE